MSEKRKPLPTKIGNANSDCAVIFIHGLFGSHNTWRCFAEHLEKKWLEPDSFSLKFDEYYAWSHKSKFRKLSNSVTFIFSPKAHVFARHLDSMIETTCADFDHIILIGHSLGGLIARKYIVNKIKETKNPGKIKALITYATPHHGSYIANTIKIALYPLTWLGFKFLGDLSVRGKFTQEINKNWIDLDIDRRIDFIRVVGLADPVVRSKSASYSNIGRVYEFANKNHFNIHQPHEDIEDGAFMVTYNYLKGFREKMDHLEEAESYTDDFDDQEF